MKRALSLCLSLILVVGIITSVPITVNAASVDDLTIMLNPGGTSYSVTGCNNEVSGELVIPNTYNGLPVTEIGYNAFYLCINLTKITIPNSVTSISSFAFEGCSSLTSITIPNSVMCIGGYAFYECTNLESITIPDSVTSIGGCAFYETAYYNNANNWENDVLYIGNHLIKAKDSINGKYVIKNGTKHISGDAFSYCTGLTSVIIPNSVTTIGERAFYYCTSLNSITIPNSVTSIDCEVFSYCTSLLAITIPDSVTTICEGTFENCTNLTAITIPDSVTSIGLDAFDDTAYYNNTNNWENNVLYIGNHLIKAKESINGKYAIKIGIKTIADYAFYYCTSLNSITIPNSVTSIGEQAFGNCENLVSVVFGKGITNIDVGTFSYCTSLTSITIPDSVTSIGAYSFNNCTNLTSITIPDNVTTIGESAFDECTTLSSVTLGNSVTTIGMGAFEDCAKLTSITIPSSVMDIEFYAFGYLYDYDIDNYQKIDDFTIYGVKGSVAEIYANENGFVFSEICIHTPSDWITDKEATVNAAGKKHKECTECGKVLETTEIPQLKCSKPKLSKIENTADGVKITWGKVSGADKYRVYRKTKSGDWKYLGSTSKTYYTDKTAKSGTKYYYAIKARNEAGNSSLSSSLSKYYLADPTLKTPTSTKSGVSLKWSKVTGAQGYIIYRKTGSGSYKKLKTEKGVSNLSYRDTSAKKGKKYTYKVKAYYSKTYSVYSNTKTIKDKY